MADRLRRIRDRHFDCYVDLASAAKEATNARDGWFDVLDAEIANIRNALEWGLATARPETAAFATSLRWYWLQSRKSAEGRQVLDRALRHPDLAVTARMEALYAAGVLALYEGDAAAARARYEASRQLAASAGDRRRQALAAVGVGWACIRVSLAKPAIEAFTEALALSESLSLGEKAGVLRGLGSANDLNGDTDAALSQHRDARAALEDAGDADLTAHYLMETDFLVQMGRPEEALVLADKAMALARAGGGDLIFALLAREKAADALGDVELLRRVLDEAVVLTQAAGDAGWEARFRGRAADHAMLQGDIDATRVALERGLRVLDDVGGLNPIDEGIRAGLLVQRARLAEDDGDLDVAEELHRQVILLHRESSPTSHAGALAALARLLVGHGDARGGRLALVQAVVAVDAADSVSAPDLRTELAIFDDDLEEALRLITESLDGYRQQGDQAPPVAHRHRAALLAELARLEESLAALEEAVVAVVATSEAADRARTHVDRARVRIALGDGDGARSELLEAAGAAGIGWANDQLQFATTFARLALLQSRGDRAAELWAAVVAYRTANRRLARPLSRRFEEPLRELEFSAGPPAPNSRAALDALRALVAEEFAALDSRGD